MGIRPYRLALLALLALGWGAAEARSLLLYGGAASARYLYTGAEDWSFFYEQAAHDLRCRLGGILWHERRLAGSQISTALFAGGAVSVNVPSLRMPIGSLQHTESWNLAPRIELNVDAGATVEPSSIAEVSAAGLSRTSGQPLLLLDGAAETTMRLRRDLLAVQLGYESLIHFGDPGVGTEEVVAAGAIQAQATWTRELSGVHALVVRPLYRAMLARTNSFSPVTGLVGAMAGWELRYRETWRLLLLGGLGGVINLPRSHLWPVEPLATLEASYRGRRNVYLLNAGWRIRENTYAGGLPMRVQELRAAWQQPLSARRWRGSAELSYERLHIGHLELGPPRREADTLQAARLRGSVGWSVARGWRLFAEAGLGVGHLARGAESSCQGDQCPSLGPRWGLSMTTLLGVAFINAARISDERVLDDRVINLLR